MTCPICGQPVDAHTFLDRRFCESERVRQQRKAQDVARKGRG